MKQFRGREERVLSRRLKQTSQPQNATETRLSTLAATANSNSSAAQLAKLSATVNQNANVAQLISEGNAKAGLQDDRFATHLKGNFLARHVPMSASQSNNVGAAKKHQSRGGVAVNTTVLDIFGLKKELSHGNWTSNAGSWRVRTRNAVRVQDTRKENNANFANPPAASAKLPSAYTGEAGARFTVVNNVVVAIDNATDQEVLNAVAGVQGNYPTGQSSRAKTARRNYRGQLVDFINAQRGQADEDATVAWVKANFYRIGATVVHNNNAVTTIAHLNAIADRNAHVTVDIAKSDGAIYHFVGTG